jgi:tRNA wybutosine-synthesizing protein 1
MAEKKQRTVYRLTLVKSWNMEEADSYVELIEKGQPGNVHLVNAYVHCTGQLRNSTSITSYVI